KVGVSKGRISQLLDPKEIFGERAGMNLAEALGLPDVRYFERSPDSSEPVTPDEPPTQDELLSALLLVAGAVANAEKNIRRSLVPSLTDLADVPEESVNIARHIHSLLTNAP